MDLTIAFAIFLICFIASLTGSILGVGGGIIIVPSLIYLGIEPIHAIPLSILSILGTSFTSTIINYKRKIIEIKVAIKVLLIIAFGTILGAYVFLNLEKSAFYFVYSAIILALAFWSISNRKSIHKSIGYPLFFIGGLISSLLGVGGGAIFTPILNSLLGLNLKRAVATSLLMIAITSMIGSLIYYIKISYDIALAFLSLTGSIIGAISGSKIMIRLKEGIQKAVLLSLMFSVSIYMILKGLGY